MTVRDHPRATFPGLARILLAGTLLASAGVTAIAIPGCRSAPHEVGPGDPWPFQPASMRIHPLTRFVEPDEFGPVIELHLEFTDADGHDSRAVGEIVIALSTRGGVDSDPLEWTVDLDDLTTNARLFRAVTRTYEIPLSVRWASPPPGTTVTLEAIHNDGAGAMHRSSMVLERR